MVLDGLGSFAINIGCNEDRGECVLVGQRKHI
jgi:hypothetical protein